MIFSCSKLQTRCFQLFSCRFHWFSSGFDRVRCCLRTRRADCGLLPAGSQAVQRRLAGKLSQHFLVKPRRPGAQMCRRRGAPCG